MRKTHFVFIIFFLLIAAVNQVEAGQKTGGVSWSPSNYTNTLSWDAVTPSTTTAKVHYHVYRQFGQVSPETGVGVPPAASNGTTYLGFTDDTTWVDPLSLTGNTNFAADYRYLAVAVDDSGTAAAGDDFNGTYIYFGGDDLDFIHDVIRADANGSQDGYGQKWTFTYKLKADAYLNIEVYPPGSAFSIGSSNSATVYDGAITNSSQPVKTILNYSSLQSAGRSFETTSGGYENKDVWDCRDSSGAVIPNGIYTILFKAYTPNPLTGAPRFVGQWFNTIPVDILRITNLTTTGISGTGGTATIGYSITGDANVYILVCSSGTTFTRAATESNLPLLGNTTYHYYPGFPLPLNDSKTAVDASKIKKLFVFSRKYGAYSETWNGLDQIGGTLPNGIYTVSLTARDGFGNNALDIQGNDAPIETTITIDRTQSETALDATAPTVSNWYVNGSAIISGDTVDQAITSVSADIQDEADGSGVNISGCSISLQGPGGSISGTTSNDGVDTITFTPATTQNTNGSYTISVTAKDTTGNSQSYTRPFTLSITGAGAAASFEDSVKVYPNPAENTAANIRYYVTGQATLTLEIYNLLGEMVYKKEWSKASAGTYSEPWLLINDSGSKVGSGVYLYRLKAKVGSSTYEATKKIIAIQ